ncbi:unnamed protein product [Rotaria sp. Silwood2]|nr:unnamed protein product [Rotaria sp. Silwood2]
MTVQYVDAWFVTSTCIFSCGLTTMDFAKLSRATQIILMGFTFVSGITISTLPALVIKTQTHKSPQGTTVDDDHDETHDENNEELPISNFREQRNLPEHVRAQLASLPTPAKLRYRAYIMCILLILGTRFTIYTSAYFAIGGRIHRRYKPEDLLQGNTSVNPWYVSFIVTVTGFNQNGLSPFSDGLSRFVNDVYLNVFVMLLVMSGTSFFPVILRHVVFLSRILAPWRHKVIFDYILLNNHRLSTLLFPTLQTRIYLLITTILYILGVTISLILDFHSKVVAQYTPGERFLIFLFQTINTRFAGFQTVDISSFAIATLLVYLLLMATKPQMLCGLDELPFEIYWLTLEAQEEGNTEAKSDQNFARRLSSTDNRRLSIAAGISTDTLPLKTMKQFLRRHSLSTKNLARKEFSQHIIDSKSSHKRSKRLAVLRIRLFFIHFLRSLIKHSVSFFILTRTWLFVFIFLICAIEYRRMAPVDPNITLLKIIFEIISAFGTVGLTLGYPNVASSFGTVLSPASKVILGITMLMGRHRGLLASMKDQEVIEYSAVNVLARRREELILQFDRSREARESIVQGLDSSSDIVIERF